VQAITFRLTDSIPAQLMAEWPALAEQMSEQIRTRYHAVLDEGRGSCLLRRPEAAAIVQNSLLHYDVSHYRLVAWVIMPNHVHIVVEIVPDHPLPAIVRDWKSFTAYQINRLLQSRGKLWSRDYFDRYMRDEAHLQQAISYAEYNPVKAGLVEVPEEWPWGSACWRAHHGGG
jgi:REP element-mobilizing transposase RayT